MVIILLAFSITVLGVMVVTIVRLSRERIEKQQIESQLILEKKLSHNQLQTQTALFETIFSHTTVGVALVNLEGKIIRANASLCQLLGYPEEDLATFHLYSLLHPTNTNKLQLNIQQLLDDVIKSYQTEQQCLRKNGEAIWIMLTLSLIRDGDDRAVYYIVQVQDITLQKKSEERLRHLAYHDSLTGLANRNRLEQFANHILATAKRQQQGFALLFLDLDCFKNINDMIGHDAGDMLLQVVAERLCNSTRNTDMVARLGGDEFVIVITDVKKTEAIALIAKKILDNVLRAIVLKGQEIYITTSIGISVYPYDGTDLQILMKNADLALYRAKENGRNNYQFYTLEMTSQTQDKMLLQNALGHALIKNEFTLHYQPQMDLKTRRIMGMEALLRWKNKEFENVTPQQIIAMTEETGLIVPVSEWIIKTACQQIKIWHASGFSALKVAVNCSARQFKQAKFIDDIVNIVNKEGVPLSSLEIEVTEETIMQDPETILRSLYTLKELGIHVVINNFGIGYWSLNNLRKLSVDKIKIDKSFIRQIAIDESSATITRAIIAMANKLGIVSMAEGVETREQYEFLVNEGCMEIQGYYLSQPLPSDRATQFLQHPIPDAEVISHGELMV